MKTQSRAVLSGAFGGMAATLPMTIVMSLWHRQLPWRLRDPLPPRKITERVLETLQVGDDLSESNKSTLTMVSHFGYGTGMGGVFGLLPHGSTPVTSIATGMAFGLGVWSGSYLGWLPATGLHRSATEEPRQRNMLMLTAHLVWGGSLGLLTHYLRGSQESNRQ